MRQYKLCIQIKITIIIIIIIIKKEEDKNHKRGGLCVKRDGEEREILMFFSLFISFSDLRILDHRFSSGLKAKLIYPMRATRGHQNLRVSSNSTR